MLIRCQLVMDGPGPSEAIVSIRTADGRDEEVVIYKGLLSGGFLEVGPAVHRTEEHILIELPREAASGQWRVWVKQSEASELQAAE